MRCSEPPTVSCRPVRVNQTPYPFLLTDTSLDETTNLDFAVEGIVLQDHLGVLSVRYQGYRLFICVEDVVGLLSARTFSTVSTGDVWLHWRMDRLGVFKNRENGIGSGRSERMERRYGN